MILCKTVVLNNPLIALLATQTIGKNTLMENKNTKQLKICQLLFINYNKIAINGGEIRLSSKKCAILRR